MRARETSNIQASASMTPVEMLYERARTSPNGTAFMAGTDRWSYARLASCVEQLACGLDKYGIRKGDRIALHLSARPDWLVAIYGGFHIGAVAAPLDHRLKATELTRVLAQMRPALYLYDEEVNSEVNATDCSILPYEKRFVTHGTRQASGALPWESFFSSMSGSVPVVADLHAAAVLLTTVGATGLPDFVTYTHKLLTTVFGLPFMRDFS